MDNGFFFNVICWRIWSFSEHQWWNSDWVNNYLANLLKVSSWALAVCMVCLIVYAGLFEQISFAEVCDFIVVTRVIHHVPNITPTYIDSNARTCLVPVQIWSGSSALIIFRCWEEGVAVSAVVSGPVHQDFNTSATALLFLRLIVFISTGHTFIQKEHLDNCICQNEK